MEVHHDEAQKKFWVEVDGYKADMSYHLKEGHLDIGLKPMATCAYAVCWLQRHPEYQGVISEEYAGSGTCAL